MNRNSTPRLGMPSSRPSTRTLKRHLGAEAHYPHEPAQEDRKADDHEDCAGEKNGGLDVRWDSEQATWRGAEEPENGEGVGRSDGAMGDILVDGPADLPSSLMYLLPVHAPSLDISQRPLPSQLPNNHPSNAVTAPATTGGSGAGSPTAPVAVPTSILTEAGGTEGSGTAMSSSSSSSPAATTSFGAEQEQPISVGATDTSSASSTFAAPATANSTTTASENNAPALPGAIIQALHSWFAGHLDGVRQLEGVMFEQEAMRWNVGVLREVIMRRASASTNASGRRVSWVLHMNGNVDGNMNVNNNVDMNVRREMTAMGKTARNKVVSLFMEP
ncbi:hypothetical protein CVT25_006883 [Psilocybe cyanescens]|uniref:Uncharacterized protein n=1 Tax=Psilocybe cyanescens TaxID=93625 RepID=A0A409X675_PSICY|nr:hypothetical protein CVT25_006883 [Psilocybe cyanescens]